MVYFVNHFGISALKHLIYICGCMFPNRLYSFWNLLGFKKKIVSKSVTIKTLVCLSQGVVGVVRPRCTLGCGVLDSRCRHSEHFSHLFADFVSPTTPGDDRLAEEKMINKFIRSCQTLIFQSVFLFFLLLSDLYTVHQFIPFSSSSLSSNFPVCSCLQRSPLLKLHVLTTNEVGFRLLKVFCICFSTHTPILPFYFSSLLNTSIASNLFSFTSWKPICHVSAPHVDTALVPILYCTNSLHNCPQN